MASPYYPPQQAQPERPWMGLALLLSIPLLSLILIRLLWSGSGLWYLLAGILFLGAAAALFLVRRNDERGPTTLADEPNRLPLVLMGIGMVFVVLLLLPNFSGDSSASGSIGQLRNQPTPLPTQPAAVIARQTTVRLQPTPRPTSQPTAQPTESSQVALQEAPDDPTSEPAEDDADVAPPPGSETYVVQDGDTLWDIASSHSVTVEAIVAANQLDSPEDLQIGDELAIPPATEDTTADVTPADDNSAADADQ